METASRLPLQVLITMATNTTESFLLTEDQQTAIIVVNVAVSVLSMLGSAFIVLSYFLIKDLRTFVSPYASALEGFDLTHCWSYVTDYRLSN